MQAYEFSFKDAWFDLETFPFRSVLDRYNRQLRKLAVVWGRYLARLV